MSWKNSKSCPRVKQNTTYHFPIDLNIFSLSWFVPCMLVLILKKAQFFSLRILKIAPSMIINIFEHWGHPFLYPPKLSSRTAFEVKWRKEKMTLAKNICISFTTPISWAPMRRKHESWACVQIDSSLTYLKKRRTLLKFTREIAHWRIQDRDAFSASTSLHFLKLTRKKVFFFIEQPSPHHAMS